MDDCTTADPVTILREIEESCRACSIDLPDKPRTENEWSGICFRIGANNLVTPLADVVEILDIPELSVVPLTQSWVRGLANLRGKLLPVIDLNGYLTGTVAKLTCKSRVLVIDCNGVYSGLVVDEVLGLKHLREDELTPDDSCIDASLQPYCHQSYRLGEQVWAVFSMYALADSARFLQVAV